MMEKAKLNFFFENFRGYKSEFGPNPLYTVYNSEDEILFEGEYINGKLNGKGRINYFENELIFEGEFMKGIILNAKLYYVNKNLEYEIKNGKGNIKYLFSGTSKYEGNYENGKRSGKGKEYNNDILIFEGEYTDGKRNGKGKEYSNDGILIFEGEYAYGKKNGKGKKYNRNSKLIFDGEYLNGKIWDGKGYDNKGNLAFEIKNGNGKVVKYDDYGNLIFEGEYLNGIRH